MLHSTEAVSEVSIGLAGQGMPLSSTLLDAMAQGDDTSLWEQTMLNGEDFFHVAAHRGGQLLDAFLQHPQFGDQNWLFLKLQSFQRLVTSMSNFTLFHRVSTHNDSSTFVKEVLKVLPEAQGCMLVTQPDSAGFSPAHCAAAVGSIEILSLFSPCFIKHKSWPLHASLREGRLLSVATVAGLYGQHAAAQWIRDLGEAHPFNRGLHWAPFTLHLPQRSDRHEGTVLFGP